MKEYRKLDDDQLEFDEAKHEYKVKGNKFTSVTTFISTLFPKFEAKAIAKQIAEGFKARNYVKFKQHIELTEEDKAKATQKYWLEQWKQTAVVGTEYHAMLEKYLLGEMKEEDMPDRVKAGVKYLKDYELTPREGLHLYPEIRVFHEDIGLAGSSDLLAISKDKIILADWKFTKKVTTKSYDGEKGIVPTTSHLDHCKLNGYGIQLMTYAYILKEKYGLSIDELHLVHLTDKAKYVNYVIEYDHELISSILGELKK